jgi:hypothetical protein
MAYGRRVEVSETTVEDGVNAYIEVLESPPNGWGANVHPVYGDSANMRYHMERKFGSDNFERALAQAFKKPRGAAADHDEPKGLGL